MPKRPLSFSAPTVWLAALGALLLTIAAPRPAAADDHWAIDRFATQDVSASTEATFRQLLRSQISSRANARFTDLSSRCGDVPCARAAAAPTGARMVVFGSLGRLGRKIVVNVTAAPVQQQEGVRSQTLSVDREEELDIAAKRLAEALVSGEDVEDTAELGVITKEEAKKPTRRDTRLGANLSLEGVLPTRGYADRARGAGIGLGLWFESMDFVIEPKLTYRSELGAGERDWDHVALDIGASYVLMRGDLAPLVGAGVGLHYMDESVEVTRQVGEVLVSTSSDTIQDSVFGFSGYLRAGLLVLRTYDVSLLVAVDYAVTFADYEERGDAQAFRLVVGVIMGGS